jgi:PAS domain S-box-containing protein
MVHDSEGNVLDVNETLTEMLGYTEEELLSLTVFDFEVDLDPERLRQRWEQMEAGAPKKTGLEGRHRRKDGSTYPVEVWVSKVSTDADSADRFIALARDITEQKERERELEEQRDNLEVLNQVVRHDIRNDLQIVSSYAELLEEHVDEDGTTYLSNIKESARNAISLTKSARDLAEVMLQSDTDNRAVALAQTLDEQIEDLRSAQSEAVITIDGTLPRVEVVGNDMLGSVFRNLLQNAIQHNNKQIPKITVSAERVDDKVTVRVADNGPGVPDKHKETIFGKGEKNLDSKGTGLGLYLVESLVDSYGGEVWVEDRTSEGETDTEGAVFVVELPVATA